MTSVKYTADKLVFQKLSPDAQVPEYQSVEAAAFDLAPLIPNDLSPLELRCPNNRMGTIVPSRDAGGTPYILLPPGHAVKLPTGLRAHIPDGYNVEMRGRSSALKHPLRLCNGVGTLDQDYRGEWFICVENISEVPCVIRSTRLVQALLQKTHRAPIETLPDGAVLEDWYAPTQRGSGGFGSTGH